MAKSDQQIKQLRAYAQYLKARPDVNQLNKAEFKELLSESIKTQEYKDFISNTFTPLKKGGDETKLEKLQRQQTEVTPQEWGGLSYEEQAQFLSRKMGIDYNNALSFISSNPGGAKLWATSEGEPGNLEQIGATAGASLGAGGRLLRASQLALTGAGDRPGEETSFLQRMSRGFAGDDPAKRGGLVGRLGEAALTDPTLPLQVATGGVGKLGQFAGKTIVPALSRSTLEGREFDPVEAGVETGFGALGDVAPIAAKKAFQGTAKGVKQLASASSGVPLETLEAYSTKAGRSQLAKSVDQEFEVGQELIESVKKFDELTPEGARINDAVQYMPEVDLSGVRVAMENTKIKPKGGRDLKKWEIEANKAIDEEIADLGGKGSLSAEGALDLRRSIDADTDWSQSANPNAARIGEKVNSALKKARTALKDGLIGSARKSGNKQYLDDMTSYADKLQAKESIVRRLGNNPAKWPDRAQILIEQAGKGKKKAIVQELEKLDQITGRDIAGKAKTVRTAQPLTDEGVLPLTPKASPSSGPILKMARTAALGSPAFSSRAVFPALNVGGKAAGVVGKGGPLGAYAGRQLARDEEIPGLGVLQPQFLGR